MDYGLNEEQTMLKRIARDFLTAECPKKLVRQMAKDDKGYTAELWHKMAELGWMGLSFPAEYGGAAGTFLDLTVLLEEMGRACLPGPFFSTVVLGGMTILKSGNEAQKQELLRKITEGELVMTLAVTEPGIGYSTDKFTVEAIANGDNYIINGTKLFVPDAHVADSIICATRTKNGITSFVIEGKCPGIKCTLLKTVTGEKQCEVRFDEVTASNRNILGKEGGGHVQLQEVLRIAAIAKCAEMVGAAQRVVEMTVEHVKQRVQFGQPVGAFQAVQHHCANMLAYLDTSRVLTYKAAWMLSEQIPCVKEAAMAKAWVSEACNKVARLGHQCIGGVAFIEDHDLPLYSKRLKAWEATFGDADFHREVVAGELIL